MEKSTESNIEFQLTHRPVNWMEVIWYAVCESKTSPSDGNVMMLMVPVLESVM